MDRKHSGFSETFIMMLQLQICRRYFKQNGIKLPFEHWEKQAFHECFNISKKARKFFSLVSPETVLYAWKNAIAKHWSYKHKGKLGRHSVTKAIKELVLKLKLENFNWGSRPISNELKKVSVDLSHETIRKILNSFRKEGLLQPTLSWNKFLKAHWESIFACDSFTVTAFGFTTYYIFFIMKLESRKIVQFGITTNPNILFLRNQISEFEYKYPNSYLIHDNSGELKWFPYSQYNIKDVRTVPYSPNMNAFAERFVRTIRQECLNYFIIFTYAQLYRIVKTYIYYYNNFRTHQGLNGRIPNGLPEECSKTGIIRKRSMVFGLYNHYYRQAV